MFEAHLVTGELVQPQTELPHHPLRLVRFGEGGGRIISRLEGLPPRHEPIDRGVELLDVEERAGGVHGRGSLADAPVAEGRAAATLRPCRVSRGRVALVTGAGSPTGIGFATARILGREGAALAIASTTDRNHERSAELSDAGFEAGGFVADLTDREQTRRMVDGILGLFGRIDILVNNAGMVTVDTGGWRIASSSTWTTRPGIATSR